MIPVGPFHLHDPMIDNHPYKAEGENGSIEVKNVWFGRCGEGSWGWKLGILAFKLISDTILSSTCWKINFAPRGTLRGGEKIIILFSVQEGLARSQILTKLLVLSRAVQCKSCLWWSLLSNGHFSSFFLFLRGSLCLNQVYKHLVYCAALLRCRSKELLWEYMKYITVIS